jgi:hypothetical protein
MSIIITNVSAPDADPQGTADYVLRINAWEIASFTHYRPDALGTCLRRAADAADESCRMSVR